MEVRRLRSGEGGAVRDLRLRALRDAPYAFSSSFAEEEHDPLQRWEALASASERADESVVAVAVDGDAFVAMAGGYTSDGDPRAAGLWGMWVAPEARRQGVAARLLEAVAGWARTRGAARLGLSVTDRADGAAALYRIHGFRPTGESRPLPSDASVTETFLSKPLG